MRVLRIRGIEESSVYQRIYAEGFAKVCAEGFAKVCAETAGEVLLRQGRKKWGEPDERVLSQIMAIGDRDRLRNLIARTLDASSWDELFAPTQSSV